MKPHYVRAVLTVTPLLSLFQDPREDRSRNRELNQVDRGSDRCLNDVRTQLWAGPAEAQQPTCTRLFADHAYMHELHLKQNQ